MSQKLSLRRAATCWPNRSTALATLTIALCVAATSAPRLGLAQAIEADDTAEQPAVTDPLKIDDQDTPVIDQANVLDDLSRRDLIDRLHAIKNETHAQIKILTVPSLQGEQIADFAQRQFNHWKLGQKGVDNGVLIVLAIQDRKVRIHTGRGLEQTLPSSWCSSTAQQAAGRHFSQKRYAQGLTYLVQALAQRIAAPIAARPPAPAGSQQADPPAQPSPPAPLPPRPPQPNAAPFPPPMHGNFPPPPRPWPPGQFPHEFHGNFPQNGQFVVQHGGGIQDLTGLIVVGFFAIFIGLIVSGVIQGLQQRRWGQNASGFGRANLHRHSRGGWGPAPWGPAGYWGPGSGWGPGGGFFGGDFGGGHHDAGQFGGGNFGGGDMGGSHSSGSDFGGGGQSAGGGGGAGW